MLSEQHLATSFTFRCVTSSNYYNIVTCCSGKLWQSLRQDWQVLFHPQK